MLIEEKFSVKSPLPELWNFLLDPKTMGPCFPGCEKVEPVSEKEYDCVIKAKVGPIAVRFKVNTVLDEIQPYKLIHTVGEGREVKNLGRFKQKTSIFFNELSKDETEISYRSEVSVVGRLATFGDRMLRAKANDIGQEFADAVRRAMSEQKEHLLHPQPEKKETTWIGAKISWLVNLIRDIWPFSK